MPWRFFDCYILSALLGRSQGYPKILVLNPGNLSSLFRSQLPKSNDVVNPRRPWLIHSRFLRMFCSAKLGTALGC
ncbi:hypothetical protein LY76DRAFT_349213 [Colletotrichum caudatum]|nr:hypothetical protein LY76DRAFT_349213 [Colletotrichum caudatum]